MICKSCKCQTEVIDSRRTEDEGTVRRIRECLECGRRYITYEFIVSNEKDKELKERHRRMK